MILFHYFHLNSKGVYYCHIGSIEKLSFIYIHSHS